jgi:hypothetical protein
MNVRDIILIRRAQLQADRERVRRIPRQLLDRVNPLEAYSDYDFLKFFRLSKETILDLCHTISPLLEKPSNRGLPLNPIQCVCLTLSFLASASFQRITGRLMGNF